MGVSNREAEHEAYLLDEYSWTSDKIEILADVSVELRVIIFNAIKDLNRDDRLWILSHVFAESSFNADAIGDNGRSFGLGQIQIPTARFYLKKHISKKLLLEPDFNVMALRIILDSLRDKFECWEHTIVVYNAGRLIKNSRHLEKVIEIREQLIGA